MNEIDLTQVDLNLLTLFECVFRERNVGRAARRLHVSSSAVSHGLGRLRALFDDPLFLRTPKGVVPTARSEQLALPIGEVLTKLRGVLATVEPFDARVSARRFRIGAPDSSTAVFLPPLLAALAKQAPHIDLSVRHLLPQTGYGDLDSGASDLLILPVDAPPARFTSKVVQEDEFVIAARLGHPFLKAPSLRRYCELQHVVVSLAGENHGYIDDLLGERGLTRRVALSVPHFVLALLALSDSELVAAVPARLVEAHGRRFGVASVKAPLALRRWQVRAIAPQVALADPGVAWLFAAVETAMQPDAGKRARATRSTAPR